MNSPRMISRVICRNSIGPVCVAVFTAAAALNVPITFALEQGIPETSAESNPLFQQVRGALKKGDYNEAIAICNKVISLNPRDVAAYGYRAYAYGQRGELNGTIADYDKAIADCNQVIQLAPKSPQAYNYRGLVYEKKGDHNKAIADFTEAIRLNPQFYG